MPPQKIVVLGTGGTIAGTASRPGDHTGYTAAQLGVAQLLQALPSLEGVALEAEQVAQVDSKDMDFATWQRLAARCAHWLAQPGVQGVVVTHGTDTLEETAWFLQRVLSPAKPLVLACAMRPANALSPDGPQNLADALAVARTPGARGVVAVCAGRIHGPMEVAKVHPYRLDAFDSGEAGPLGLVEEGAVRLLRDWPAAGDPQAPARARAVAGTDPARWPRVEIVLNHAGADGRLVEALRTQGIDGLVVAGTGNGTVSGGLEQALLDAQAHGVAVVRSTRCALGRVVGAAEKPLPQASTVTPVKARVSLLLDLMVARVPQGDT
ncbi:asparaginase [Ramlibacter sp. MAHUQ-53]|uniref:asparaginase n=1 Tax=unclassified Ramlibacter TaxID=2617605 RepID=UPI003645C547